jgi:hypothetical protein
VRFKLIIIGLVCFLNIVNAHIIQCSPDYISLIFNSKNPALNIVVPLPKTQSISIITQLSKRAPTLSSKVIYTSYIAYIHARALGYDPQQLLTIVDYTKPSSQPRLWVFDLKRKKLVLKTVVAHGVGSGRGLYVNNLSNTTDSYTSSIGVMLTGAPYIGYYGYSLDLYGLEPGFNDKAYERRIVMHSWPPLKKDQTIGRSNGCLVVSPAISENLINRIKDGTIIVSYFPDPVWLKKSTFLN